MEAVKDSMMLDRLVYSQKRALDELKLESEELYNAAIQVIFLFFLSLFLVNKSLILSCLITARSESCTVKA